MSVLENIKLTNRELLYISAFLDAVEFYGISDGFFGMDENEINSEIINIQNSLLEKKYADMDFNGKFEIATQVLDIVKICVECEKYITVDAVSNGKEVKQLLYYFNKSNVVEILQLDNEYQVSKINPSAVQAGIISSINWLDNKEKVNSRILLRHEVLTKVKGLDELSNPVKELSENGCDSQGANIIYRGLTGKANYYSIIIVNFETSETEVMSLMVINSKDGSLELVPVSEDENEAVEFRPIDFATMCKRIKDALSKIGVADGEGFV